eukprot:8961149-Alexandrium_andersonii.AAC.1
MVREHAVLLFCAFANRPVSVELLVGVSSQGQGSDTLGSMKFGGLCGVAVNQVAPKGQQSR